MQSGRTKECPSDRKSGERHSDGRKDTGSDPKEANGSDEFSKHRRDDNGPYPGAMDPMVVLELTFGHAQERRILLNLHIPSDNRHDDGASGSDSEKERLAHSFV